MLPLQVVLAWIVGERAAVGESHEERLAGRSFAAPQQLVNEALTATAAMHEHVLHLNELAHVRLDLKVAPSGDLAGLPLREAILGRLDRQALAFTRDVHAQHLEKPARLR